MAKHATTLAEAVKAIGGEENALKVLNTYFTKRGKQDEKRDLLKWAKTPEGIAAIAAAKAKASKA